MKTFDVSIRNTEGQTKASDTCIEEHLYMWVGKTMAGAIVAASALSGFHFKLTLESDTEIVTIERREE